MEASAYSTHREHWIVMHLSAIKDAETSNYVFVGFFFNKITTYTYLY